MVNSVPITEPTAAERYDGVPYPGAAFRSTHPDTLAAMAHMLGVPAAPPDGCRVLELGCCDGGNLIPMAATLPTSTFVGVDYSPVQIEAGRDRIKRLGLTNIDLRPVSIADITPDWGKFDYVISHGVFSWVPPGVRDALLKVCRENLAPDGIAYVSYNTLPGWHLRGIIREMMRYHAMRFDGAQRQIEESRLILQFVAAHAQGTYAAVMADEAKIMAKLPDHYLYHEHLEEHCEPFYFHQFMEMAQRHGLDYLGETRLAVMSTSTLGETAERAVVANSRNVIELEQFMDFLRNGTFRQTLLRHASAPPPSYDIDPARLAGMYLSSDARPDTPTVDLRPSQSVQFSNRNNRPLAVTDPMVKSALLCLVNAFPSNIGFDSLTARAADQLRKLRVDPGDANPDQLAAELLSILTTTDLLDVTAAPSRLTVTPGEKPIGFSVARIQAESPGEIATARHDIVRLTDDDRAVLRLLDGTRTAGDVAGSLGRTETSVRTSIQSLARHAVIVQ